ncbi:MAG: hypothetical protein M5R40_02985 [Anaerolineae bacterium]|nr:hypothetical protein [Anaerolineae bacterium]
MSAIIDILRRQARYWIPFLVGLLLGLLWAWQIAPVVWTDAGPVQLSDSYKEEWIKLAALQYEQTGDRGQAERLVIAAGDVGPTFDRLISENATTDPALAARISRLQEDVYRAVADDAQATQRASDGRGGPGIPALVLLVAVIIILWGVAAVLMSIPLIAMARGLLFMRGSGDMVETGPSSAERLAGVRAAQQAAATQAIDYSLTDLGTPVGQYMTTYLIGDDLYDDSFSVEKDSGEFLGETGAGISETIGVGDPKKVTAIEVWLFDKNDIRTVTKVLMSEHAYYDENMRARLAPKGEAVLVEPNGIVVLETNTLRVQARVVDLAYAQADPMPTNSVFERLTLELASWEKEGAAPAEEADAFGDTMSF